MKTIADFGHFNELPTGFTIVTEKEFYDNFFKYSIGAEIFRQPRRNIDEMLLNSGELFGNIRMFPLAYEGCSEIGYGIAQVWHTKSLSKRIVFFKFGLQETWVNINNRMCAVNANDNS